MATSKLFIAFFLAGLLASGCSPARKETSSPASETSKAKPSTEPILVDPALAGRIHGAIRFEGSPPPRVRSAVKSFSECALYHPVEVYTDDVLIQDGRLQNTFVYIKEGLEGRRFKTPAQEAVLDQIGCIYTPHVLGIQVNQSLLIKNSDVALHNVHSHSVNQKPFNFGMPVQGMVVKKTFSAPEIMIKVTCDVHSWMKGYIGVLDHPFFSVSGPDGRFEIQGIPPGSYVLEAWHEQFGTQAATLTLGAQEKKEIDFIFQTQSAGE